MRFENRFQEADFIQREILLILWTSIKKWGHYQHRDKNFEFDKGILRNENIKCSVSGIE